MTGAHGPVAGLSWTDMPTHLLQAELFRRQQDERPMCGTKGGRGHYNTPIHVFALILILALSTGACSFPIVVKRFPRFPVPHHFLFLSRHFGTGVLIATAFVHLLPTAFESLTDPCLPRFWNKGYSAMPGLIAMTAVFVVVGIEMFFASKGVGHVHDYEPFGMGVHETHPRPAHKRNNSNGRFRINGHVPDIVLDELPQSSENLIGGRSPSIGGMSPSPRPGASASRGKPTYEDGDDEDSDLDLDPEELGPRASNASEDESRLLSRPSAHKHSNHSSPVAEQTPEMTGAQHKKQLLQCLLLEAGILFHSVFIGMALSVATGTSFIVLLVAISFHQTFEGFALGSRISAVRFSTGSLKPWLMALAYGTTTPIGQAIGLGIHNLYDPASQTGLLMVGFMNAISSGLLLFAGLVELLAEDFLSDESYVVLKGKRRLQACASVVGGAALMALVGAWA
ncbi:Zinc/iron permease [Lentithecium fluviatile CBS 122367]|uniref:Zinc/iron permease n=1 Tax=Lentithecium fluviatile CBS 122367 TaxID=1168545 RepID=A0A6G1IXB0_9PLEO|nr:Zinc/iron permease [Lentithecium fluviatile CBS 122367]